MGTDNSELHHDRSCVIGETRWYKTDRIIDWLAKILVPLIILYIGWLLHGSLQQNQLEQNRQSLELQAIDMFYSEISSNDVYRQKLALSLLKLVRPQLAEQLVAILDGLEPGRKIMLSNMIVKDQSQIKEVRQKARSVLDSSLAGFRIDNPGNGDSVGIDQVVVGHTVYPHMKHYIIVTPISTQVDFVASGLAQVSSDGTLLGVARIGGAGAGLGQVFAIRVLATSSDLIEGVLQRIPEDAQASNTITVIRK